MNQLSPLCARGFSRCPSGTNRLSSVANASGTRGITYDGRGNTANETRPGSVSATTGYDGYGRLTAYARTDIGTLSFGHLEEPTDIGVGGLRRRLYQTSAISDGRE